ncbi:MAG: hypothetical protein A2857_03850 [Candidatus Levybacteria bacterium RIFCSPHIGHO2_01_FULL_36_15]|nr:MAG: hypothetical protein A2857_03850 [Candidatus Levybacteria bacterium RIFCSPHIGHO2_01_FULL_36_15]OGH38724.1 MAG: hypothetical protein A2905_03655 [Candidatus Levybacteria bacterium RIFCSPLOWO2_01_FULL_36_10]
MDVVIVIAVLVFSAILHEVMHGFVADKLGDPTARLMGRLTLNPIPHIDPLSSILIPFLLVVSGSPIIFGAAKPVPVNPIYFKEGRKDMALVALAGPLTNIVIAVTASVLLKVAPTDSLSLISMILYTIVFYNLILAFINLIPIPPLDGSKVVGSLLPDELASTYFSIEPYGIFIIFFLLVSPLGGFSLGGLINKLLILSLKLLGL